MSQQPPYRQPQGQPGKDTGADCEPPPPPPPCPDPCDQSPPWGPPEIRGECCPDDRGCCRKHQEGQEEKRYCTWDDVEDPCVRAVSAECETTWTKLTCNCTSSNEACTCEEWDCDGYPRSKCVPCKPCEGVIGDDSEEPGGCTDPGRDGCDSEGLRTQLEALKKCISSQQGDKARIEAEIKAGQDREKELAALIGTFDAIVEKYRSEHHRLRCREDCLKGFYRDMDAVFRDPEKYAKDCLDTVRKAINSELCTLEKARCCQVNLQGKLSKATRLIWEKGEAEKALKKADDAFAAIKDLPKWMGDQFAELEALKDQIATGLNDKDVQKHKWAFYLFYWRFAPKLCRRFPVAVCCEPLPDAKQPSGSTAETPAPHIGCEPGDWHPSRIDYKALQKLICCAWDYARAKKKDLQEKTAAVEAVTRNLAFVQKKNEDDAKSLEERIKTRISKVECKAPPTPAEKGERSA